MSAATPAEASPAQPLDLPAGRLGDAVAALGRQAQVSIMVDDAALWQRRVPAIRGTLSVKAALARLLDGAAASAARVGPGIWRIRADTRPMKPMPVARAAPSSADAVADIVVTASKRDLHLRDYPGMASVIAGADLTFGGERGTDSILARLATVSSTYLGAGRNKLFIRGIADSSFTGPTQATVGQYLGDIRLTYNAPDPDLRLYDMRSVEVLEGPQGTLYGAGSLGGIIRTVPSEPVLGDTSGTLEVGVSATEHGAASGDIATTINLPVIADRVGLRVVGYGVSDGGYIDNPLRHKTNINRTTVTGGRATLRVDAGDGWMIDVGGILQRTEGGDSQYADRDAGRLVRNSPVAEGFDATYRLGELIVTKNWGGLHFSSSTGLIGQDLHERYDATPPGGEPRVFRQGNNTRLLSTEARLWQPLGERFGWVLGASYIKNETRLARTLGDDDGDAPVPVTGVDNRVHEITLYGEASIRLAPWITATAGGRFSHSLLSGAAIDQVPSTSVVETLARASIVADRTTNDVLPSGAIVVAPLPKLSLFARYQEGFRPGGLAVDGDFVRRFRSDHVATIEGGVRYGAPGADPIDLSLVLSHTDWRDIQADFLDVAGLPTTDNIGNGRIWSLAASLGYRPMRGLRFDTSVAFNDGRVTTPSESYRAALLLANVSGGLDRIPNVARVTGRVGMDWQRRLNEKLEIRLNAWGRYVGRSRLGVGPVLGAEQGDYIDSALNVRIGTDTMGLTIGVTNLGDSIGNRFALGTPFTTGRPQITPLRPRTLRLGFDAAF